MNGEDKKMDPENSKINKFQEANEKQEKHTCSENNTSDSEILENGIPKSLKALIMQSHISGSISSPIPGKLNEQHIDKIIQNKENNDVRNSIERLHRRKFQLVYILIAVALFVFLTLFLVGKDTELYKDIIKLFIAFVGGMGAGYGIKKFSDQNKQNSFFDLLSNLDKSITHIYQTDCQVKKIGNAAVKAVLKENREKGLPIVFSRNVKYTMNFLPEKLPPKAPMTIY